MTPEEMAAQAKLLSWRADPVRMVVEEFRADPDEFQIDALRAFASGRAIDQRISLQACAGVGKSAVLSWCGWNFLSCYADGDEHPNGFAISGLGADNLRDGLWKEMAVWRDRSQFLRAAFDMTKERIFSREHPATWWLAARTYPKAADPEAQGRTLSGLHAPFMLYLVDESGEAPASLARTAQQGLGSGSPRWAKILQAGNPTSHTGMLHLAAAEQSHLWRVIIITGDPDDPKRSTRVDIQNAREQITLHGRTNPWVMAYILGQFPPSSINALLGPDEVRAAIGKHLRRDEYEYAQKRIGGDVARFGDDATVLFPRQGLAARNPVEMRNARTNEIAARWAMAKQRWGSEMDLIDDTGGWGAGVIDSARMAGLDLYPVNFSGKADDPRYYNKRAEMHFRAAEWVKAGGALPNLPHLVGEACASTYTFKDGKLLVLEKDQIKAILGRSPDYWDALCLTFAVVEQPSGLFGAELEIAGLGGGKMLSDFDPYRNTET